LLSRSIVDDDVEAAEPFEGARNKLLAELFVAEIARDGQAVASFRLDQGDDLLCVRLLVRKIIDGDVGAFACIGDGGGAAHAGIAAGDEGLAAGEPARSPVAFFAVIGTGFHLACKAGPRLGLSLERRLGKFAGRVL
jgi:hypothetical protein